jgi:hypothetical protein
VRFEADRHRVAGGPKITWYGDSAEWQAFSGVPAPRRVSAWWSDQAGPWFEVTLERVAANTDVTQAMQIGRSAIARARERQGRHAR